MPTNSSYLQRILFQGDGCEKKKNMTQHANFLHMSNVLFWRARGLFLKMTQDANFFISSTYCFVGEREILRLNMWTLFTYSMSCLEGEWRGWDCWFQRFPFRFGVPIIFVSTLSFPSQLFPLHVSPFLFISVLSFLCQLCPFRFNSVLSFQPCPLAFNSFLFRLNPVLSSQLLIWLI